MHDDRHVRGSWVLQYPSSVVIGYVLPSAALKTVCARTRKDPPVFQLIFFLVFRHLSTLFFQVPCGNRAQYLPWWIYCYFASRGRLVQHVLCGSESVPFEQDEASGIMGPKASHIARTSFLVENLSAGDRWQKNWKWEFGLWCVVHVLGIHHRVVLQFEER